MMLYPSVASSSGIPDSFVVSLSSNPSSPTSSISSMMGDVLAGHQPTHSRNLAEKFNKLAINDCHSLMAPGMHNAQYHPNMPKRMTGWQQLPKEAPSQTVKTGMKDVPYWLKTLRLHKYTPMMQEMSYDKMINLNEQELEERGVTKGARRKILQSIAKLKQRATNLRRLAAVLESAEYCLRCAIVELRQIVATPLHPYVPERGDTEEQIDGTAPCSLINDKNVPALMVRLLHRVFTLGVSGDFVHEQMKPELLLMYFTICDRMLMNEAFTSNQKRRIVQWRRAARRFASPAELRRFYCPAPPPPRCESCMPVSTYYFNDSYDEILRVQNLQRMVKQYLASDPAWWQQQIQQQRSNKGQEVMYNERMYQDSCRYSHQAVPQYNYNPSSLPKKAAYSRAGPVPAPPPPPAQYRPPLASRYNCPVTAPSTAVPVPALPLLTRRSTTSSAEHPWQSVYDSYNKSYNKDLFDLMPVHVAKSFDVWADDVAENNGNVANASRADNTDQLDSTSGYSSSGSEHSSSAVGSPRGNGPVSALRENESTPFGDGLTVYDFGRTTSNPLDTLCESIAAKMRTDSV